MCFTHASGGPPNPEVTAPRSAHAGKQALPWSFVQSTQLNNGQRGSSMTAQPVLGPNRRLTRHRSLR
jgi:hypothetical protein